MKKAMSIQSQCLAAGLAVLTLLGTSACKKSESEQKNFKAETGALWWKKEATLVSLPYYVSKAPVQGQSTVPVDESAISLEDTVKSCWYYSEKPEDPFFAATSWSPTAVTLDALFQGMSEGKHKDTLRDLKDTWLSSAAGLSAGLSGTTAGLAAGTAVTALAASAVICAVATAGACLPGILPGLGAMVASGTTAGTVGTASVIGVGAVVGGITGGSMADNAVRGGLNAMTNAEFEAKFEALVASTSAEKRKKLKWNQVEALKDIVMTAPSSREGADVCARPEQLTRAAVSNYIGAANMPTTP